MKILHLLHLLRYFVWQTTGGRLGRSGGAAAAAGWKIGTVVGSNTDKNKQVRELELTAKNVHKDMYMVYMYS